MDLQITAQALFELELNYHARFFGVFSRVV
jgi:hypothetical protein